MSCFREWQPNFGLWDLDLWQSCRLGSDQALAAFLIRRGLGQAEADKWEIVFVLGSPAYYRRFGFDPALASGFTSPYAGPHLMALGLTRPLPRLSGKIDYAPAFAALG
jgi:putative acetyltransferase